jgi:sec-independent protein translocase protein TatA
VLTNLVAPTHIAILLAIRLLTVGPKRLPQTGRALGSGIRELKDAISGNEHPTGATPTQAFASSSKVSSEEDAAEVTDGSGDPCEGGQLSNQVPGDETPRIPTPGSAGTRRVLTRSQPARHRALDELGNWAEVSADCSSSPCRGPAR